jgi:hypothetical protein
MSDVSSVAYLRPETAQGIFTNFPNVQRTARMKVGPIFDMNIRIYLYVYIYRGPILEPFGWP